MLSTDASQVRPVEETRPSRPTTEVNAGFAVGFDRLDAGGVLTLGIVDDQAGVVRVFDRTGALAEEIPYLHGETLVIESDWVALHISGFALEVN